MTERNRPGEPATPADALRTPAARERDERPGEPADELERAAEEGPDEPLTDEESTQAALDAAATGTATTPLTSRTRGAEGTSGPATRDGADELPRIDDRVSKLFVASIVAVFTGIFLYALLFGRAGALTPRPTEGPTLGPSPVVSISPDLSPGVSGSPAASGSPSPAVSGSPSGGGSPSPAVSGSPSPVASGASPAAVPSASPVASPSGSPAASPSPAGS